MKQCGQCREWIDERALVCRSCGARFSAKENLDASIGLNRGRIFALLAVTAIAYVACTHLDSDEGMNALVNWSVGASSSSQPS